MMRTYHVYQPRRWRMDEGWLWRRDEGWRRRRWEDWIGHGQHNRWMHDASAHGGCISHGVEDRTAVAACVQPAWSGLGGGAGALGADWSEGNETDASRGAGSCAVTDSSAGPELYAPEWIAVKLAVCLCIKFDPGPEF